MGAQQWVTLTVGLVATFGVLATLWQRQRSEHLDRRERAGQQARADEQSARAEWWRRWQWAVELAVSGDAAREAVGVETLAALVRSPLVTVSESDMVEIFLKNKGGSAHESGGE